MKFHILSNEIVNKIFAYSLHALLDVGALKDRSDLDYKDACSFASVSVWWRSMITSQLAREIAKLDEQRLIDVFTTAVSRNRLMSLHAIYASVKPPVLNSPRPSSLSYASTTIEEQGLCTAAQNGSCAIIQCLMVQGVSPNATDAAGIGALHKCASGGEIECARLLLENGAHVNLIRRGGSPLHCAVEHRFDKRRLAMMHLLLENGADLSSKDQINETVLYRASGIGLIQEVELLLDHGAAIEDGQNDWTPLMVASRNRRAETTRLLLKRGASLEPVLLESGKDSLCLAVTANNVWDSSRVQLERTIESLIEYGADVNGNAQSISPLCLALSEDSIFQFTTVEVLLNAGADTEKPDSMGDTPLETWISKSSWYTVGAFQLLLKGNANVNRLNREQRSPLAQVCAAADEHPVYQRLSIIQTLIQYKADIDLSDENGDTPAMIICMNSALVAGQKYRLLKLLLQNGANIWLENRHRETLLIKAMRHFGLGTKERRKVLKLILHAQELS